MSEWFAVKGVFRWYFKDTRATARVEERIVLFQAEDFDQAILYAEREALSYCAEDCSVSFAIEAIGLWDAYLIGEKEFVSGMELYSRLMNTSLSGDAFVRRYFPKSHAIDVWGR